MDEVGFLYGCVKAGKLSKEQAQFSVHWVMMRTT